MYIFFSYVLKYDINNNIYNVELWKMMTTREYMCVVRIREIFI